MALTALLRTLRPTAADRDLARAITAYPAMRSVAAVHSLVAGTTTTDDTAATSERQPALAGR